MKENNVFNKVISAILVVCGIANAVSFLWLGSENLTVFYIVAGISALIALIAYVQVVHQEKYHEYKPFNFWVGIGAAAAVILVIGIVTVCIFPEHNKVILPICTGFYPFIIPMGGAFLAMMWRTLVGRPIDWTAIY